MSHLTHRQRGSSFSLLRRLAQPMVTQERCDLCGILLAPAHRHLWEVAHRQILCACDPCALRFHDVEGGRFKLIPREPRALPDFRLTPAQWENLALPINLASFVPDSASDRVIAFYPSPAGAIESLLTFEYWNNLVAANPALEIRRMSKPS